MLRLETVDARLAALVEAADDVGRRRAALSAARFARARTGLRDDSVDALLVAVDRGEIGDTDARRAVDAVAVDLDEAQWRIQDRVDAGEATIEDHLRAFSLARAASAAACVAEEDARVAAMEALYEAHAAVGDLEGLRQTVVQALT